jgi:hypothetical protein
MIKKFHNTSTLSVREFAATAKQHGVQSLWGRCYENPGAPPSLESPEQARVRLFDSVTSFLPNAARTPCPLAGEGRDGGRGCTRAVEKPLPHPTHHF